MLTASIVYGVAMFVIAIASNFNGFLVGMAARPRAGKFQAHLWHDTPDPPPGTP